MFHVIEFRAKKIVQSAHKRMMDKVGRESRSDVSDKLETEEHELVLNEG